MTHRIRSRNWCFTDFELIDWKFEFENNKKMNYRYICWGIEECPTTNKIHYQGWFQIETQKDLSVIKKQYPKLHLEMCKGTESQNDKYCQKNNKYFTIGEYKIERKSDLQEVCDKIKNENLSLKELIKQYPVEYRRYKNGLRDLISVRNKENTKDFRKVEVICICGKTGTNKTTDAMNEATFKINGNKLKWWDEYDNDEIICIDEFDSQIPIDELLHLLDGWQCRLEIKRSHTHANWRKVYITSNLRVEEWYPEATYEYKQALDRRITFKDYRF